MINVSDAVHAKERGGPTVNTKHLLHVCASDQNPEEVWIICGGVSRAYAGPCRGGLLPKGPAAS